MNTIQEASERIVQGDDGVYYDSVLENAFASIFNENYHKDEYKEYLTAQIDPYVAQLRNGVFTSFKNALSSTDDALEWASQFGDVQIWRLNEKDKRKEPELEDFSFGAAIGSEGIWVFAKTKQTVLLLAGLQIIRELADIILNGHDGQNTVKH